MKHVVVISLVFSLFVAGCAPKANNDVKKDVNKDDMVTEETGGDDAQIANPASENCVEVGGEVVLTDVEIDGEKFGQYGVCEFEDNMQCEEWALMRGECPEGGVKVTGYVSKAAVFCAITGGEYVATSLEGETFEQGICTGNTGIECEAWDHYRGVCSIY